jgi:hypothetical protein
MSHTVFKTAPALVSLTGLIISLTFSMPVAAAGPRTPAAPPLQARGGGSSTGGGHVRVCLTPNAAARVKNNILLSTQSPQIGVDALAGITRSEIVSVDLLDLIEQPAYSEKIQKSLQNLLLTSPQSSPLEALKFGLTAIMNELEKTGFSVFDGDKSDFPQYAVNIASNTTWTPSDSGLALTRDFDPKISNKENCVFAQAVRQEVVSPHFRTLIYDERIFNLMSGPQLTALGLHEAVYNLVLNSPARLSIENASVLTRQLTVLMLMALTDTDSDFEAIAESLESIGYGPFDDMIRPSHRLSREQLKKYLACQKPFVCKSIKVRK